MRRYGIFISWPIVWRDLAFLEVVPACEKLWHLYKVVKHVTRYGVYITWSSMWQGMAFCYFDVTLLLLWAHAFSCSVGTVIIFRVSSGRGVMLTTHLHMVRRWGMSGVIVLTWHVQEPVYICHMCISHAFCHHVTWLNTNVSRTLTSLS